ncbi:MAG TPA: hypothetical protein VNT30_10975 [Stellaceae bacterium]|nr:hypothetical protein [Stellaceae bacterium]
MVPDGGVIEGIVGVAEGSALADALAKRARIMALSQASYGAVLTPRDPGGLSHPERAALALRMARLNADDTLAAHYADRLAALDGSAALLWVADPAKVAGHGARLDAIIRHVDLLTREPRAATRGDIEALKRAGVIEADIVRLAELAAFLNYQARVIAGFRLLKKVL